MQHIIRQLNGFFIPIYYHYEDKIPEDTSFIETIVSLEDIVLSYLDTKIPIADYVEGYSEIIIGYKITALLKYRYFEKENDTDLVRNCLIQQLNYFNTIENHKLLASHLYKAFKSNFDALMQLNKYSTTNDFAKSSFFEKWLSMRIHLEFCLLTTLILHQKRLTLPHDKVEELSTYLNEISFKFETYTQNILDDTF